MKEELITKAYEVAKERYAALGIDVEKVMEQLQKVAISMHCWQADDVIGFESGSSLTGGIQTTGNYPGKARNMEELRSDILKAASYIPGKHRLNLHEIYGDFGGTFVDRDQVEVKHFESWMQWAAENGMKLDFNSTSFFKDSLDRIFATEYKNMKDCLESKVFGIGLESYTVGSNEFCVGYSVQHQKLITIDTGHFHPTESAADKVSSMLLFVPELMLHVSRPIRWDSDHVTIMDDPTLELFQEIVRCNALDRVHIGLDYFDASINRIGAYVIGTRAAQKCMLRALLEPLAKLREYEAAGQGFQRLALLEEAWNAVWDMFCLKNNVPVGEEFIAEVEKYEAEVTSRRN